MLICRVGSVAMAIVSEAQVIKVLQKYNPWWRNADAINEETKPQKRVAFFEAMKILEHHTIRRFPVLSGARRVGKSTIMYGHYGGNSSL